MGGVYGEINSRADFERVLREARTITRRMLGATPSNPTIAVIDAQLDAMERWTAAGVEPTKGERERINVGLIAVRELDDERQDESGELARKLYGLDSYCKEWPTDEQAASATDADYWARFGL
jgi:hypothetical protein